MEIYYIWLALFAGIGLRIQHALLQQYGDPRSIYTTSNSELQLYLQHIHSKSISIIRDLKPAESTCIAVPGNFSTKCHIFREIGKLFVYGKGNKNSVC